MFLLRDSLRRTTHPAPLVLRLPAAARGLQTEEEEGGKQNLTQTSSLLLFVTVIRIQLPHRQPEAGSAGSWRDLPVRCSVEMRKTRQTPSKLGPLEGDSGPAQLQMRRTNHLIRKDAPVRNHFCLKGMSGAGVRQQQGVKLWRNQ